MSRVFYALESSSSVQSFVMSLLSLVKDGRVKIQRICIAFRVRLMRNLRKYLESM